MRSQISCNKQIFGSLRTSFRFNLQKQNSIYSLKSTLNQNWNLLSFLNPHIWTLRHFGLNCCEPTISKVFVELWFKSDTLVSMVKIDKWNFLFICCFKIPGETAHTVRRTTLLGSPIPNCKSRASIRRLCQYEFRCMGSPSSPREITKKVIL